MGKLKPYSIEYRHHGKTYVIEVYAESKQDAQDRMRSAYFNGETQTILMQYSAPKWLVRAIGGNYES